MELTPSQENDVKNALRKHPNGVTFDTLFDATTLFVEERELSGAIFRMTQQASIYKKGSLYFSSELAAGSIKQVEVEPAKVEAKGQPKPSATSVVARAVAKASAVKLPPPPPPKAVKPQNGNLRRHAVTGMAAMVLYRYRNEGYSLPVSRIQACLPDRAANIYASMNYLETRGYVKRHGTGRDTIYNWTGKFNYPFSTVQEDDNLLVRIAPKSERTSTLPLAVSPAPAAVKLLPSPGCPVVEVETCADTSSDAADSSLNAGKWLMMTGSDGNCCSTDITPSNPAYAAIQAIDAKIKLHQERVDFLKDLRVTLLAALAPETSGI